MFDFRHILPFERAYADNPGPMVLFASPGMLHAGSSRAPHAATQRARADTVRKSRAGTSLDVFKKWAGDERNMVIMPGYCVAGTVGAKVLAGQKQVCVAGT